MNETTRLADAAPARKQAGPPELQEAPHRVVARFYRRMKAQHVFPLHVQIQQTSPGKGLPKGATGPVLVRCVIPGTLVNPAELSLTNSAPDNCGTFYITPLARGSLRQARLEVLSQGRALQQIALPMRVVTQRLTWILAALAILAPAFLLYATRYHKLTGTLVKEEKIPLSRFTPEERKGIIMPAGPMGPSGSAGDSSGFIVQTTKIPGSPGELLEKEVNDNVPDIGKDSTWLPSLTKNIAWGLGRLYDYACELAADNLSFWVGVVLLALTLISVFTHRPVRARRRSKPLSLVA